MKTKELIKKEGLSLFNSRGMMSVTLRDIAKELNKSYGNVTYHFPKKEDLIVELYYNMVHELVNVSKKIFADTPNLQFLLFAPHHNFDVSLRYAFLFRDYVALIRTYPKLAKTVKESNEQRKSSFLAYLLELQNLGYLQPHLRKDDLDYLMELSGAMRTFFFFQIEFEALPFRQQKRAYVQYINKLLFPYLTEKGQKIYRKLEENDFTNE